MSAEEPHVGRSDYWKKFAVGSQQEGRRDEERKNDDASAW